MAIVPQDLDLLTASSCRWKLRHGSISMKSARPSSHQGRRSRSSTDPEVARVCPVGGLEVDSDLIQWRVDLTFVRRKLNLPRREGYTAAECVLTPGRRSGGLTHRLPESPSRCPRPGGGGQIPCHGRGCWMCWLTLHRAGSVLDEICGNRVSAGESSVLKVPLQRLVGMVSPTARPATEQAGPSRCPWHSVLCGDTAREAGRDGA